MSVNERPVELFGGEFVYRAVQVPAGLSIVRFTYHSSAFPFLVVASWGTLALVLFGVVRRRRPMRPAAEKVPVSAGEPADRPAAQSD